MIRFKFRIFLSLFLLFSISFLLFVIYVYRNSDFPTRTISRYNGRFVRIAHRCGRAVYPENTLFACKKIAENNMADILEMDVHPTKDGKIVVIHDSKIDRTTNGHGYVKDHTLLELQKFDAGYQFTEDGTFPFRNKGIKIQELEDFFKELPLSDYYIELKDGNELIVKNLIGLILKYNMQEKVIIGSAKADLQKLIHQNVKGIPIEIFASYSETALWYLKYIANIYNSNNKPQILTPPYNFIFFQISREMLKKAASENIPVHVWTVNDRSEIERLKDLGVNGIMTDNPNLFIQ